MSQTYHSVLGFANFSAFMYRLSDLSPPVFIPFFIFRHSLSDSGYICFHHITLKFSFYVDDIGDAFIPAPTNSILLDFSFFAEIVLSGGRETGLVSPMYDTSVLRIVSAWSSISFGCNKHSYLSLIHISEPTRPY